MKQNNCPMYAQTHSINYRCFLTGLDCRIENYEICGFYKEHFARQIKNDAMVNSQPTKIPNIAQNITDAIDHLDTGVRKSLMKTLGDTIMFGELQ